MRSIAEVGHRGESEVDWSFFLYAAIGGINIIQVPANILDRRFEVIGVFKKAQERDKEVFVRSVFLQGLLLIALDQVPDSMKYVLPYLERLEKMASKLKLSRKELILGYAARRWGDSFVLFGVENSSQIVDNLRVFSQGIAINIDENYFANVPENILNPSLWPKS
jgi:aryl-alcohol dehydrogenase-like predicted oxidoreductase